MRSSRALMLAAFLTAAPAFAQVAPPPPEAPPPTPEHVPPAPTEQPRPINPGRAPSRQLQPGQSEMLGGSKLPDIPYESLVTAGEDGKIKKLIEPSEYAAVSKNPLTKGPIAQAELARFIHDRTQQFELIAIENLDILLELDAGFFEQVDFNDRSKLGEVTRRVRPLTPPASFGKEAEARGIMTRMQAGFNSKIAREYDNAVTREARAGINPNDPKSAGNVMAQILRQSMSESLYAYRGLCLDVANHLDAVKGKLTLNSDEEQAFKTAGTSLAAASSDEEKVDAVKALLAAMSLEKSQQALNAAREARPEAVLPEVPEYQPMKGIEVIQGPEQVKAKRQEIARKQAEIREAVKAGKRGFRGPDGKVYFMNPDGTARPATEEELDTFERVRAQDKEELKKLEEAAALEEAEAAKKDAAEEPKQPE